MTSRKFPIKVGQTVILYPTGNAARQGIKPFPGVITEIKRKYFYVISKAKYDANMRARAKRFSIDTFTYDNREDVNTSYLIFPSDEALATAMAAEKKLRSIRQYFNSWHDDPPDETTSAIYDALVSAGCIQESDT